MSLSSLSLVLGAIGTVVAVANQAQHWVEKRRGRDLDEHRLDVEGLRTLVTELRTELVRARAELLAERDARAIDRARISELETRVGDLTRELRRAEDTIDKIRLDREMRT